MSRDVAIRSMLGTAFDILGVTAAFEPLSGDSVADFQVHIEKNVQLTGDDYNVAISELFVDTLEVQLADLGVVPVVGDRFGIVATGKVYEVDHVLSNDGFTFIGRVKQLTFLDEAILGEDGLPILDELGNFILEE